MATKSYKGSHGTRKEIADKILKDGFAQTHGKAGRGVYFWDEQPNFVEVALKWCVSERERQEKESGVQHHEWVCAALTASIVVDSDNVLDFEARDIATQIEEIASENGIRDWRRVDQLLEDFVINTEKRFDIALQVVLKRMPSPGGAIRSLNPWARCIIVRDTSCIDRATLAKVEARTNE